MSLLQAGTVGLSELRELLEELDSGTSQHGKVLVGPGSWGLHGDEAHGWGQNG